MKSSSSKCSLLSVLLLAACSEEKKAPPPVPDKPAITQPAPSESKPVVTPAEPSPPSEPSVPEVIRVPVSNRTLDDIRSSLAPLNRGADVIATMRKGWSSFTHPVFTSVATPEDFARAMERSSGSLSVELRDPSASWNTDAEMKRAVVGRLSLMTALFGAGGSHVARFPQIIADAMQRIEPTEEDLLTLRIVEEASLSSDNRPDLRDVDLSAWNDLARSANIACRATALVAYKSMQTTPEQQVSFYRSYVGEANLQVAKSFVEQLGASNIPEAATLLKQFKTSSPVAPQLGSLIEQNLAVLKQNGQ